MGAEQEAVENFDAKVRAIRQRSLADHEREFAFRTAVVEKFSPLWKAIGAISKYVHDINIDNAVETRYFSRDPEGNLIIHVVAIARGAEVETIHLRCDGESLYFANGDDEAPTGRYTIENLDRLINLIGEIFAQHYA